MTPSSGPFGAGSTTTWARSGNRTNRFSGSKKRSPDDDGSHRCGMIFPRVQAAWKKRPHMYTFHKRFYKPIYLPLLSLLAFLIFFTSKEDVKFTFYKYIIFSTGIMTIVISEITVKYVSNIFGLYLFVIFPLFTIFSLYSFTHIKSKKNN